MNEFEDQLAGLADPLLDFQNVLVIILPGLRRHPALVNDLVLGERLLGPDRQEQVHLTGRIRARIHHRFDISNDVAHLLVAQRVSVGRHLGRQPHRIPTVHDDHLPVAGRLPAVE